VDVTADGSQPGPTAILRVDRLHKHFGGNRAVDGATFDVARGSITGLIGPNGAGKTTCFNCIAGALRPDSGHVTFDGHDITGFPPYRVTARGMTRTFQIPQELGAMSVLENVMLAGLDQAGERLWESWLRPWRVAKQERDLARRAEELLALVDLGHLARELAGNLSGGQRKLLELARALMPHPRMVLLDEPSAGVNPTLAVRLADHIRTIRDQLGVTFLLIAHDMDVVERLCETVVVMAGGRVLTEGAPAAVFANAEVQEAYLGSQVR
jgi:ABC-type branched-subunit amino acid transport system ATPase component